MQNEFSQMEKLFQYSSFRDEEYGRLHTLTLELSFILLVTGTGNRYHQNPIDVTKGTSNGTFKVIQSKFTMLTITK